MPPRVLALLVALVLGLVVSCLSAKESGAPPPALEPAAVVAAGGPAPGMPAAGRAMRITVTTDLKVEDLSRAAAEVRKLVESTNGYVAESRSSGSGASSTASFTVRIPTDKLELFRTELAKLGEVTSLTEKAEDVTEQRADIDARLRNARAQERRLLDLLSEKAGSLADVIAIEKELASVRETVERLDAQQRTLEGQIAFATVTIGLYTPYNAPAVSTFDRIGEAASGGIKAAGSFVIGLIVVVMYAGPTTLIVLVLFAAMYFLVRAWWRRRSRHAASAVAPMGPAR